jgi:hypothetical protein
MRAPIALSCEAMNKVLVLLLTAMLLAPAYAQERGTRGPGQRDSFAPRERQDRESFRRERHERREERREHRFTHEEREKLRQDIMDANKDLRRRR